VLMWRCIISVETDCIESKAVLEKSRMNMGECC
jgi:hypothetical protein